MKPALDLSLAIEAADKDASEIQKADGQGGDASVNKVDVKVNKGSEVKVISWFFTAHLLLRITRWPP